MAVLVTTMIDFGSTPVSNAAITVTDAGVVPTTTIDAFVVIDSTADNTVGDHQLAATSWRMSCQAASGSFTLYVDCLIGLCYGTFKVRYVYV